MAFFASNYLLQGCLRNHRSENQKHHPHFLLDYLRSPKYAGNNVGKSEIVFKRAWLIAVIPPKWIGVCDFYPEIHEVLELHFYCIIMMSLSRLALVLEFPVENA